MSQNLSEVFLLSFTVYQFGDFQFHISPCLFLSIRNIPYIFIRKYIRVPDIMICCYTIFICQKEERRSRERKKTRRKSP